MVNTLLEKHSIFRMRLELRHFGILRDLIIN